MLQTCGVLFGPQRGDVAVHPWHIPLTHSGVLPKHICWVDHCPLASQVSARRMPLHRLEPGVQTTQAPFKQTGDCPEQVVPLTHTPAALHVWGVLLEHCTVPGVHATHAPLRHAGIPPLHAAVSIHAPAALQVCTVLLEQRTVFGVQATHPPLRQAGVLAPHAAPLCHCPFASQV